MFDTVSRFGTSAVVNGLDTTILSGTAKILLLTYTVKWRGNGAGSWRYALRQGGSDVVDEMISEGEYDVPPLDEFKTESYKLGIQFEAGDNFENVVRMGNLDGQSGSNIQIVHELDYKFVADYA